jgi:hypothetical protein
LSPEPIRGKEEQQAKLAEKFLVLVGLWSHRRIRFYAGLTMLTMGAAAFPKMWLAQQPRAATLVMVAVAFFESVSTAFRRLATPHWTIKSLRGWLCLEIYLTLGLWGIALLLMASAIGHLVVALLLIITALGESLIAVEVWDRTEGKTRSYYVLRLTIGGKSVGSIARRLEKNFVEWRWLTKYFRRTRGKVSRYAKLVVSILLAVAVMNGFAFLAPQHHHAHGKKPVKQHAPHHSSTAADVSPAGEAPGVQARSTYPVMTRPSAPPALTWEAICGRLPGSDAPEWARPTIYSLLLGENGPGATIAGCATHTITSPDKPGFAYTIGGVEPKPKSVTVVARNGTDYPASVFLAPAVAGALDLIHQYGTIGGSPRFNEDFGDAQFAYSNAGTTLFLRETKVARGRPDYATPYTELPPSITEEWYADVAVRSSWLWASQGPDDLATGRQTFLFTAPGSDDALQAVEYDPTNGTAYIKIGTAYVPHSADGRHITLADVQAATR